MTLAASSFNAFFGQTSANDAIGIGGDQVRSGQNVILVDLAHGLGGSEKRLG